jgi:uncharacterized membrane protein
MDLITILVGLLALYLWRQVHQLSERVRLSEQSRFDLEEDLDDLHSLVTRTAALGAERTEVTGPPVTPAAAPVSPAGAAEPLAGSPGLAPGAPEPAMELPVAAAELGSPTSTVISASTATGGTEGPSATGWKSAAMASETRPAWSSSPAPAGPGLGSRLLERMGLEHTDEGSGVSRAAIEAWLEGRMLAVVGGIALVLGAAFFLSLAFSRGWITEPLRVLIGLAGGATAIGIGELAFMRLRGVVGHVLVAVGLAIISLALLAATRLFGLIPAEAGVAAALAAAVVAAFIAIRHDSQLVAAFGLVSVLAAPPLLGATPTPLTILFLAAALIGTTAIALFRTWVWLPPVAFLLAAPQVASSVGGQAVPAALVTIAGFWLLNTIAAGGEEIRRPSDRLRPTTVTLLLSSAGFTVGTGLAVLDGGFAVWRGSFVAALAIAHLALGLGLLGRYGDRHPFGLVVAATGLASISLAVPIQFGAPWVPVAWAAEGLALSWLAVRYRHPFAAGAALVLGAISLAHVVGLEYPLEHVASGFARTWPFVGPEGLTFAFVMAAAAAACVIIPLNWVRAGLGIAAILTTAYVLPFELSGPALVVAWSSLTVLGMAAWRFAVSPRLSPSFAERGFSVLRLPEWSKTIEDNVIALSRTMRSAFAWTVGIPIAAAIGHLAVFEFPAVTLGSQFISGVPYLSPEGLAAAAAIGGLVLSGALASRPGLVGGVGGAAIVVVYTLPFEVLPPYVMIAWGVATVGSIALVRRVTILEPGPDGRAAPSVLAERVPFLAAGVGFAAMVIEAVLYAGPVSFLRGVVAGIAIPTVPFVDDRTVALGALAATLVIAGWAWGGIRPAVAGLVGAGLTIAWLLPFEVRPAFAIAGWAALAAAGLLLVQRVPASLRLAGVPSLALLAVGGAVGVLVVAPPSRLVVDPLTAVSGLPILTEATLALVSLALACGFGARLHREDQFRVPGAIAAGLLLLYAVSIAVVDIFQWQVGTRPLQDLQREAQLALSLLWSVLGGLVFVLGLRTRRGPIRRAGLALLGLATAKVFLVDLAALDVAYRVLSLVGLGVLLLVSAIVYARQQERETRSGHGGLMPRP